MKKSALIIFAAVIAGSGYTAASWYFGKQTEAVVAAQYDQLLASAPYLKLVERDYQRGIFSAQEVVKLEINKKFASAAMAAYADSDDQKPFQLELHSHIQHGPFPGFRTFAAAVTDVELRLPEPVDSELKQLLGDQSPFTQQTTIMLDGSGQTSFSSPAFEVELPAPEGQGPETLKLTWRGIQGNMDFSANMKQFRFEAQAPELLLVSQHDGVTIKVTGMSMQGDQSKLFDDIPVFFSGSQQISIDELSVDQPESPVGQLLMKGLSYEVDLPHEGEFVDLIERMSIERLSLGEESLGPIHFDYSLKRLHARAVAEVSQAFMSLYTEALSASSDEQAMAEKLMPVFMEQGKRLLEHQPEFHLDRVSLANEQGESSFSGQVKLEPFDFDQAMANPMMLITKLDAIGELDLQEEMVLALLRNPPGGAALAQDASDPEALKAEAAMRTQQFQQQVAMLSEQGYLIREGNQLKSKAAFKQGQLTINGKPFVPPQAGADLPQ
jgi:uncharacterized protein YdgA (DUF945 family)